MINDNADLGLYGMIIEDAEVEDAEVVDAGIDGDLPLPYAAPPILDFPPTETGIA